MLLDCRRLDIINDGQFIIAIFLISATVMIPVINYSSGSIDLILFKQIRALFESKTVVLHYYFWRIKNLQRFSLVL